LPGGLQRPDGIAVDGDGNVYVSDWLTSGLLDIRIVELSATGRVVRIFPEITDPTNPSPTGQLAIGPPGTAYAGRLYVAFGGLIVEYAPGARQHTIVSGLGTLGGVANGQRTIYIATQPRGAPGYTVTTRPEIRLDGIYSATQPAGIGETSPHGVFHLWKGNSLTLNGSIAIGRGGDVYAVDDVNGRVERFSATGRHLGGWGPQLSPTLKKPAAVALDARGNVYVADGGNNRILKLSPAGRVLDAWSDGGTHWHPGGLAVDRTGTTFALDRYGDRVVVFGPNGRLVGSWRNPLSNVPPMPAAIAVDSRGVYVTPAAGLGSGNVLSSNRQGADTSAIPVGGANDSLTGIALDRQGDLYVADASTNEIYGIDPSGIPLRRWGSRGTAPGRLIQPGGLAIDRQGRVYVADTGNKRIDAFSPTGTFLQSIGGLDGPVSVAVDAHGALYVVARSRIEKLVPKGT
jgi:sugar lactone lactonase YvrE